MNIIQWDNGWQHKTLFSEIRVDKLNIIQWDNGWQTVDHKTLFSEIRVDKLNIIQWDKGWQIDKVRCWQTVDTKHYSVR